MKNQTLICIMFMLILNIASPTSGLLHANETIVTTDTLVKPENTASFKTLFAKLALVWSSLVAHEAGHALAASLIKPGSVKKFYIGLFGGYVNFDFAGLNTLKKATIYFSGPLAGSLFSYAAAKATDVTDEYQNDKNIKSAIATGWKKPLYTDPKDHTLKEIKHSVRTDMLIHALNLLAFDFPGFLSPTGKTAASDGSQILKALEFPGDWSHVFQVSPGKILLWNVVLLAGIYNIQCLLNRAAQRYQEQEACEDQLKEQIDPQLNIIAIS